MQKSMMANPFADPSSRPMKTYGCMAIAGSSEDVGNIHREMLNIYNEVSIFSVPDDHGSFPDTQGYTAENFADLESVSEDPQLFKVMQKCMDFVMDKVDRKYERFCMQYPGRVEKFIHWPKFGGNVFAVVGFVKVYPHIIQLVH